ncbi:FadR/GntR family transcriptional regulator [Alicyclobacillus fastidiosus]|uniref:FadR/GntR family transcriptional regulator n=1 Tax=Alicyclobacillus fastidiosus TaxID=392011 RepID=A0ABV5A8X3_9BACL|nr:FadR/GntR family transcriptional regulator [Alicyclobacillus fastidiosus]WEH10680.1 FadR/GntR family transcriptional regulator [Alicyclobacillus fastidiosus]
MFESTLATLEERIRNGIWRPGDRLPPLQKLSEELNVGISTLREVLRILESRNVIAIEQGRGTFIRTDLAATHVLTPELTETSLQELFEARRLLEPELAYLAAQRGFMDEIRDIDRVAKEMSRLIEGRQNFDQVDVRFHHLIARAAHNDMLFRMFQSIETQFHQGRSFTNMIPGMIEKAAHYHLIIAAALCQRNAEQARSLMQSHVEDMRSYVLGSTYVSEGTAKR